MKAMIKAGCLYVNGVFLTPEAIGILDMLQTGGTINWEDWGSRTFGNDGIKEAITDIEEINAYFIKLMLDDEDEVRRSVKLMRNLSNIRYIIEQLKLPDELLTTQS